MRLTVISWLQHGESPGGWGSSEVPAKDAPAKLLAQKVFLSFLVIFLWSSVDIKKKGLRLRINFSIYFLLAHLCLPFASQKWPFAS